MPETAKKPDQPVPVLTQLHRAILWAVEQGIPVAPDVAGVVCTSRSPHRWERDPRAPSVCPLGALILQGQPPTSDLQHAQLLALHTSSIAFVSGLESGLTRATEGDAIFLKPATRPMYLAGLEVGCWLRGELVGKACMLHGRFPENHIVCPVCADEARS